MSFTKILKNAVGIEDNTPQRIDADGKQYTFVPGQNGSLTAPAPAKQSFSDMLKQQNTVKSKVIMPPKEAETEVGSSRG